MSNKEEEQSWLQQGKMYYELGNIESDQSYWTEAISYYDKALSFFYKAQNSNGIIDVYNSLGLVHASLGEYTKAHKAFDHALTHTQEDPTLEGEQGKLYANKAYASKMEGDYPKAMSLHKKSLVLHRRFGKRRFEGIVLGNIGNIYSVQGDYEKAIAHQQASLDILKSIQAVRGQCICLHNLADAYRCLGSIDISRDYYAKAQVLAESVGDRRLQSIIHGKLLCISLLFNKDRSVRLALEEICTVCEELQLPQRGLFYYYLAQDAFEHQEMKESSEYLSRGRDAIKGIPEFWGMFLCLEAKIQLERGEVNPSYLEDIDKICKQLQVLPASELGKAYQDLRTRIKQDE